MRYLQGLKEKLEGIRFTGEISAPQFLTIVLSVGLAIVSVQLTGLYANSTDLSVAMRESSFQKGLITGRMETLERFNEMTTDCVARSARIEGYLDALLFSSELESEEQLKRIVENLRRRTSDN